MAPEPLDVLHATIEGGDPQASASIVSQPIFDQRPAEQQQMLGIFTLLVLGQLPSSVVAAATGKEAPSNETINFLMVATKRGKRDAASALPLTTIQVRRSR